MTLTHILAFNLALLAAMASPGPAFLLLVRTALAEGRLAGILTGCGLTIVASGWTLAALLGLSGIFAVVPWLYMVTKIAGALYLIHIAWRTWRDARAPLTADVRPARHAFRDGMIVNLLNPKAVLFSGAVLVVIFPPSLTVAQKLFVAGNHLVVEIVVYALLATVLSTPAISRRYLAAKAWLDRAAALALGALGLRLLVSR